MDVIVSSVDYEPPELGEQVPFSLTLLRMLAGRDRPDYWLGRLHKPIRWVDGNHEHSIDYLLISCRWVGGEIAPGFADTPIGIAYVTDQTQVDDAVVDFAKCRYVAIGVASELATAGPDYA